MNLIQELQWRGLIQDIMPGTEEWLLHQKNVSGYIGFDPTADSLHVGSLLPILLLVHFQRAGHRPVALVGGATGMVGDPSGKSSERQLLDESTLQHNLKCIQEQLERFLDFSPSIQNKAIVVNNYNWFKSFSFLDFIRDVGKHITVNYMMSKESVRKRLQSEQGISFTEFSYQLVQGYDFLWLHQHENCTLQMGGSDQWGNITTGAELIRRKTGKECFAFTCPLIKKSDGSKFGKSADGNIWLDAKKTSPYHFYQFWMKVADDDAIDWIKKFTFLSQEKTNDLISSFQKTPHERLLQKTLAEILTTFVHGKEAYHKAVETSNALFGNNQIGSIIEKLTKTDFEDVMKGVPVYSLQKPDLDNGIPIIEALTKCGLFPSKGEARKSMANGAILINKERITEQEYIMSSSALLYNNYILVNVGKKNYYLISCT